MYDIVRKKLPRLLDVNRFSLRCFMQRQPPRTTRTAPAGGRCGDAC
jgi:hypothetical protein